MSASGLTPQERSHLEDAFFAGQDATLVARMRARKTRDATREALGRVAVHADDDVIDRLVELGIDSGTLAALALIPLVEIAWADGKIDPPEREAILREAHDRGIEEGTDEHTLLEGWLTDRAGRTRLEAWMNYTRMAMASFDETQRERMRDNALKQLREIARAAGGVLGIGSISHSEREVIDQIASVF